MWRTELIPQTSTNIGTGTQYYHFSLKTSTTNPPDVSLNSIQFHLMGLIFSPQPTFEHQILFFESHFTEVLIES